MVNANVTANIMMNMPNQLKTLKKVLLGKNYEGVILATEEYELSNWIWILAPVLVLIIFGVAVIPSLYYNEQTAKEKETVMNLDCPQLKQFIIEHIESDYRKHDHWNYLKAKELHEWKCEK